MKEKQYFTELLAPAGSVMAGKAALAAGADAIYIGGSRFGARAYADNPDTDNLLKLLDYTHMRNKKLYLTVNTLLKEDELYEDLFDYLSPLYEEGLDAVIVQDPGVLSFISREFSGLHIHASTQMVITGDKSAALLKEAGASRVVTARELSLKEIKKIRDHVDIEIEAFVHGALCYCYSGRCLFSSMLGGRSGNRGRCAQPCRLPYELYDHDRRLNGKNEQYLLSPRDMCTVTILPEIIKAGVNSLKIEGRMKKPEYTAGVVSIYRKYLDQFLEGSFRSVSKEDLQSLYDLYNRDGFNESYYKQHNGKHMMALKNEKTTKSAADRNEALFSSISQRYCQGRDSLPVKGQATFLEGEPMSLYLQHGDSYAYVSKEPVEKALHAPATEESLKKQLSKTGESEFYFSELSIEHGGDIFVPVKSVNTLRREGLQSLQDAMLVAFKRTAVSLQTSKPVIRNTENDLKAYAILVSTKEQLNALCKSSCPINRIYLDYSLFTKEPSALGMLKAQKKAEILLVLPQMLREEYEEDFIRRLPGIKSAGFDGYLVRTLEELAIFIKEGLSEKLILDACLYTFNSEAMDFYRKLGISFFTAPLELNKKELINRDDHDSEMIIYGRMPLMVSAQCLRKNTLGCDKKYSILSLKDRKGIRFPSKCSCDFCYNTIYNSVPLQLFKEIRDLKRCGFAGLRIEFTTESEKETLRILAAAKEALSSEKFPALSGDFTKGHYQRGVE